MIEPELDLEIRLACAVAAVCSEHELILKFHKKINGEILISAELPVGVGEFPVKVREIPQQFLSDAGTGDFSFSFWLLFSLLISSIRPAVIMPEGSAIIAIPKTDETIVMIRPIVVTG